MSCGGLGNRRWGDDMHRGADPRETHSTSFGQNGCDLRLGVVPGSEATMVSVYLNGNFLPGGRKGLFTHPRDRFKYIKLYE